MCLAVPGKIFSLHHQDGLPMAEVDFSGVYQKVCLIYTPEASIGDYVIVHVGFAISILNEMEAKKTLELLS